MQVVAVFSNPTAASTVVGALQAQGVQTMLQMGISGLVSSRSIGVFDAMVIEDDGVHLETWLPLLRARLSAAAPIVVYGPGESDAMASALRHGAQDYATTREGASAVWWRLSARCTASRLKDSGGLIRVGEYRLDRARQLLTLAGRSESLTAREAALMASLSARPGFVVAVDALSADLCGRSAELGHRAIEQHVYRLRRKIDDLHAAAQFDGGLRLASVYGVGYRLDLMLQQEKQDRAAA